MSRRTPYAYTGSRLGRCHLGTRSAAQGHVGDIRRFHHGLAHDLKDLGAAVDMDGQESSRKHVFNFLGEGGKGIFSWWSRTK